MILVKKQVIKPQVCLVEHIKDVKGHWVTEASRHSIEAEICDIFVNILPL